MSVVVVGLQHTQAPLPLLEAVAVPDGDLHKVLGALSHRRNVQEAVVLSTCLRTEVYAVVDRFHDAVAEIYEVLSEQSGVSVEELSAHATIRFDDDVTSHLFAVTSGLESVVTGESEVVGQVRRAFERAHEEGTSRPRALGPLPPRAADGQAGAHRDGDRQGHDLLRLRRRDGRPRPGPGGAARRSGSSWSAPGDMGLGVCRALSDIAPADAPPRRSWWSTARRAGRGTSCARPRAPVGCGRRRSSTCGAELAEADVVLAAVAAESHVLAASDFAGVTGPLLVIDLGVPRNVDPAVADLRGRHAARHGHAQRARWPGPWVTARRSRWRRGPSWRGGRALPHRQPPARRGADHRLAARPAESLRVAELERHRAQLADLTEAEWEQVDAATRAALAKMLHEPTILLKETAGTPRGERLVEALRILFDL